MTSEPTEAGDSGAAQTPTTRAQVMWQDVEYFLGVEQGTIFPLQRPGDPRVDYVVTDEGTVALHLQLGSRQAVPRSPLPLVHVDEISRDGLRMARIELTRGHLHLIRDFHDLLNAVSDRIVGQGRTPDQAFQETIRAWSALLEKPRGLDTRRRIGLLGELTVLSALAEHHGWTTAVASWKGPDDEEHDFGLPEFDVEVKTTSGERRLHTVQGLGQLTATAGRPLWIVSHQITRGGAHGRTLTECALTVRTRIEDSAPYMVDHFDQQMSAAGWSFGVPDDERWSLRNSSLVLPADDRIPKLDTSVLDGLPLDLRTRIDDVSYRIDLTGIDAPSTPPNPFEPVEFHLPIEVPND